MKKEVIDNSTNSPRLKRLQELIDMWLNECKLEDNENLDIGLIILGYDKKYKHTIQSGLTGTTDPVQDIADIINHSLSGLKEPLQEDIFNGMGLYLASVCARYPKIWKTFKENVKMMQENKNI